MINYTKRIIFNKFTVQLLLMFILVGCSKSAMYATGAVIKKIPIAGGIVAAPLQYAQQEENKRIAAENRRRREAEEQIKQAEYDRWFNSLPQEKQVEIRLANEKTRQKQLERQTEGTRQMGRVLTEMLKPDIFIID